MQQTGRAGRDESDADAIHFKNVGRTASKCIDEHEVKRCQSLLLLNFMFCEKESQKLVDVVNCM